MDKVEDDIEAAQVFAEIDDALKNDEENDIFNNLMGLYMLGEFEFKKANQNVLLANPMHKCTSQCTLTLVDVRVYRTIKQKGWFGDKTGREVLVHLCFTDSCEHLDPHHRCEEQEEGAGGCPHMRVYARADMRTLKDFWTCNQTGNVHICGEMCDRATIISDKEGDFICELTGQVVTRSIVHPEYFTTQQQLLKNGEDPAVMQQDEIGYALEKKGIKKLLQSSARSMPTSLPPWERVADLALYHACVTAVCDKLLFSEERQMMEADNYIQAYESAYEDVAKALRVRKVMDGFSDELLQFSAKMLKAQQMTTDDGTLFHHRQIVHMIKTPLVLAMFQFKRPTSIYFHNIPIMDSVNTYMRDRIRLIDSKYANIGISKMSTMLMTPHLQHVGALRRQEAAIEGEIVRQRRAELLHRMVMTHRENTGIGDRTKLHWSSPEWQQRMKNLKEMFAHCLVRVWTNMSKFNALTGSGAGINLGFNRCLLTLLYMTRKTMSIPEDMVYSSSMEPLPDSPMVTVIPKLDFAMLLPPENQLDKFNLSAYSNNSMSRRLTTTQTEIKNCLYSISRKGHLKSLQLRIIDIYAEIHQKQKKEGGVPIKKE